MSKHEWLYFPKEGKKLLEKAIHPNFRISLPFRGMLQKHKAALQAYLLSS